MQSILHAPRIQKRDKKFFSFLFKLQLRDLVNTYVRFSEAKLSLLLGRDEANQGRC